jgi:hypothetical protein
VSTQARTAVQHLQTVMALGSRRSHMYKAQSMQVQGTCESVLCRCSVIRRACVFSTCPPGCMLTELGACCVYALPVKVVLSRCRLPGWSRAYTLWQTDDCTLQCAMHT